MWWLQRRRLRLFRGQEGSVAVEFAIALPVLLLLLWGIIEMGNVYYRLHMVNEAARVGARMAAVGENSSAVTAAVKNLDSSLNVDMVPTSPTYPGDVTVTVTSAVQFYTPIISVFFSGNPYTVTGRCIMKVEE